MKLQDIEKKLDSATTYNDVLALTMPEIVNFIHIICGPGGKCMCGVYDGESLSCAQILQRKSSDILHAVIQCDSMLKYGGDPVENA